MVVTPGIVVVHTMKHMTTCRRRDRDGESYRSNIKHRSPRPSIMNACLIEYSPSRGRTRDSVRVKF